MLSLWIRDARLAKAATPPEHHPAANGGRPIADNPNLIKRQVVDRNGRMTTRYFRRDGKPVGSSPKRAAKPPPAPKRASATESLPDGSKHTLTVERHKDGRAHIASSAGYGGYHLPSGSVPHHFQELERRVDIAEPSDNTYVDAVRRGKAKWLGQGEDGMVFQVGDKAVKVSTVTPYQRYNPKGFRTPEEGIRRLRGQVQRMNELREAGVPGVPKVEYVEHGDRAFAIQDMLATPEKLTPEQLEETQRSVRAMHQAGFTINDRIQVGIGSDGHVYHYDLGHAEPLSGDSEEGRRWRITDDLDRLKRLYDESGHTWEPLGLDREVVAKVKWTLSPRLTAARVEKEGLEAVQEHFDQTFQDLIRLAVEDDEAADYALGQEDALRKHAEHLKLDPQAYRVGRAMFRAMAGS